MAQTTPDRAKSRSARRWDAPSKSDLTKGKPVIILINGGSPRPAAVLQIISARRSPPRVDNVRHASIGTIAKMNDT